MSVTRAERRMARKYTHETASWRPCWRFYKRPCLRCMWREVTGKNARGKEVALRRMHEMTANLTPIRYRRNTDGRWEREAE